MTQESSSEGLESTVVAPTTRAKPAVTVLPETVLPSSMPVEVGACLKQRFQLEATLGRGGMGTVYKALDLRRQEFNDREAYVAIKVLNADIAGDSTLTIALQREAKRAQNLPHPNIINVYDFDRDGSNVYMTMEYLEGRTLAEVMAELPNGMPLAQAWPWIKAMGDALHFAHQKGIVHCDFKPGNVFVTHDNNIKVVDFGLAALASRNPDADATLFNSRSLGAYTPVYATQEAMNGEPASPSDDIYAFGCTVYQLLSGKHPYARVTAKQAAEARIQAKRLAGLNNTQWEALEKAIALQRDERGDSLASILDGLAPKAATWRLWLIPVAIATVAALALAGWFWLGPRQVPVNPPPPIAPDPGVAKPPEPPPPVVPQAPRVAEAMLVSLGANRAQSQDGSLAAGLERNSFKLGETIELRYALAQSAHVYIVYLNSANEVAQIYPNRFDPDRPREPGKMFRVPPGKNSGFNFRLAEPAGRDRILVIASDQPIANAADLVKRNITSILTAGFDRLVLEPGVKVAGLGLDVGR